MRFQIPNSKYTFFGTQSDFNHDKELLHLLPKVTDEYQLRKEMYENEILNNFNCDILYSGNTIIDKNRIVKDFKKLVKSKDMNKLTDNLYKFFHLHCGSIAHYNKEGWISTYPTVSDLYSFLYNNEYGQDIVSNQPYWYYDSIETCKELLRLVPKPYQILNKYF